MRERVDGGETLPSLNGSQRGKFKDHATSGTGMPPSADKYYGILQYDYKTDRSMQITEENRARTWENEWINRHPFFLLRRLPHPRRSQPEALSQPFQPTLRPRSISQQVRL